MFFTLSQISKELPNLSPSLCGECTEESFGTFFGDLSQPEKYSELKLPLEVILVHKISYIEIDRNDNKNKKQFKDWGS